MRAFVGEEVWEDLERREMSEKRGIVRDLTAAEWEPRHQLRAFFDGGASQLDRDAALESFEWPWEKTSLETLAKLDSIKPDYEKQEIAALRYQYEKKVEPVTVSHLNTVVLPLLITISIIIALVMCGAAIR